MLVITPSLLPAGWQYYIYSPASVGLWALGMLIAPFTSCVVKWEWIKTGRRKA